MNNEHINGGASADTAADKGSRSRGDRRNSRGQSQGQAQSHAASNEESREQRSSRSRRRTTRHKTVTLEHKRPQITPEGQGEVEAFSKPRTRNASKSTGGVAAVAPQ